MVHCASNRLFCACNRIAVGFFREQGCERSELPCLAQDERILGRRSWSFLSQSVLWTVVMPYCAHYRLYSACNRTNLYPTSGGILIPNRVVSLSQIGWWNTVMVHLISCILLADFKFFSEFCNEVVHGNDILSKEHGEVLPSCSLSPHGNSN